MLHRFRILIIPGLILAVVRLISEFMYSAEVGLDHVSMRFSVNFAFLGLWVFAGLSGVFDDLGWKRLILGAVLTTVIVWGIPNSVGYSAAQLNGWNFGRYSFDQAYFDANLEISKESPDLEGDALNDAVKARVGRDEVRGRALFTPADGAMEGIGRGIITGLATSVFGSIFNIILASLFVGIPMSRRRKKASVA